MTEVDAEKRVADKQNADQYVTRHQAHEIGKRAAIAATHEIFQLLGHDLSNPESTIQIQVDNAWVRRQRTANETMVKQMRKSVIAAVTVGLLAALWLGIQEILKAKTGG